MVHFSNYLDDLTMSKLNALLTEGKLFQFADLEKETRLEGINSGVYTIWMHDGELFLYAGMSGKAMAQRLKSHNSGMRSDSNFCTYVADRFILKGLTDEQISQIAEGRLSMDNLIRDFIRQNCSYRVIPTDTEEEAKRIEDEIRWGDNEHMPPFLNPRRKRSPSLRAWINGDQKRRLNLGSTN